MALAPLHNSYSLDVLRGNVSHTEKLPTFWLWLIRFHIGIVYFFGGIAKFDTDWLNGFAPKELMLIANRGTVLETLTEYSWVPYFYAWSGMLFDLLIPFLMVWKPVQKWAFLAAVLFHTNNYFVFPIGIFPVLSLVLTMMFFDADFPRKITPQRFRHWLSSRYHERLSKIEKNRSDVEILGTRTGVPRILLLFFGLYITAHLVLPFRHLLNPGVTIWHEEGHYFAWRMMLRQKVTRIKINVTHPDTGEERYADPRDYLNSSQFKVFAGNPQMILLFVHHLDRLVHSNAGFDPKITAEIQVSLNGRPFRDLVDPNLDLSEIPPYQPTYQWIKPFGEH